MSEDAFTCSLRPPVGSNKTPRRCLSSTTPPMEESPRASTPSPGGGQLATQRRCQATQHEARLVSYAFAGDYGCGHSWRGHNQKKTCPGRCASLLLHVVSGSAHNVWLCSHLLWSINPRTIAIPVSSCLDRDTRGAGRPSRAQNSQCDQCCARGTMSRNPLRKVDLQEEKYAKNTRTRVGGVAYVGTGVWSCPSCKRCALAKCLIRGYCTRGLLAGTGTRTPTRVATMQ